MNLSQERERELERAIDVLTNHLANKSYQAVIDKGITCINEFEEVESHLHLAKINSMIGYAFYNLNKLDEAIRFYEWSVKIYGKIQSNESQEIIQIKNSLSTLYRLRGKYLLAFRSVQESIQISERNQHHNATGYNNLGIIYNDLGKQEMAIFCFKRAIELAQNSEQPNPISINTYLNNLCNSYLSIGKIGKAAGLFRKVLNDKNSNKFIEMQALKGLGLIYFKKKLFAKAQKNLEKALELCESTNNLLYSVHVLEGLTDVYYSQKKELKYEASLMRFCSVAQKFNVAKYKVALEKIINFYLSLNQFEKAIEYKRQLIDLKNSRVNNKDLYQIQIEFEISRLRFLLEKEYKYRKKLEKKNRRLSKLHAMNTRLNYRIELLHKQLQPAFIFNTLQDIQRMAMLGDKMAASDHIAQFATLMRLVLQYARREKIHVLESVDLLKRYLQLDISRQGKKVECTVDCGSIETDEMDFFVPPFFISSLVLDWLRQTDLPDKGEINIAIKPCKEGFELTCDINRNDLAYKLNLDEPQSAYWYDERKQAYWLSYANLEHFTASINVQANVPTQAYLALRIAG